MRIPIVAVAPIRGAQTVIEKTTSTPIPPPPTQYHHGERSAPPSPPRAPAEDEQQPSSRRASRRRGSPRVPRTSRPARRSGPSRRPGSSRRTRRRARAGRRCGGSSHAAKLYARPLRAKEAMWSEQSSSTSASPTRSGTQRHNDEFSSKVPGATHSATAGLRRAVRRAGVRVLRRMGVAGHGCIQGGRAAPRSSWRAARTRWRWASRSRSSSSNCE